MSNTPWFFEAPLPKRKHDLAHVLQDFETFDEVVERRRKLISTLRWKRRGRRQARKLARCRKDRRCGSPICPVCLRRFRRWFVGQALTVLGAN